jgi:hypothetical protein
MFNKLKIINIDKMLDKYKILGNCTICKEKGDLMPVGEYGKFICLDCYNNKEDKTIEKENIYRLIKQESEELKKCYKEINLDLEVFGFRNLYIPHRGI